MADGPLILSLPPATDYITYLAIIEFNLTENDLPTLHSVLQDPTLTVNIGWDLVHLLLPFLPASQVCLQVVARLGNPREVVLKVTELLEELGIDDEKEGEDDGEGDEKDEDEGDAPNGEKTEKKPPSKFLKFTVLTGMLEILHPRIKTKYPSRFLSASLQAVLAAYSAVAADATSTEAVLVLLKVLSEARKPEFPSRDHNSDSLVSVANLFVAPDPEAQVADFDPSEMQLQTRLLQSFFTHMVDEYASHMPFINDVPGLAWTLRFQETTSPEKMVPGRKSFTDVFEDEEEFGQRDIVVKQMLVISISFIPSVLHSNPIKGPYGRSQT